MLRFLSNYIFQNENENDPSTTPTPTSSSEPGPKGDDEEVNVNSRKGRKEESMDFEEERGEDSDEEEDDWVLIGDGEKPKKSVRVEEPKKEEGDELRVQEQPVSLVAAPSEPEQEGEDDQEEESEEEEEGEESIGLLWENKLIEHPSMSVYVDLATSLNTNCTSMSSIAPATSPGDSVIVIGDQDEEDDEDDDEAMDIIEVVPMPHQESATPEPIEIEEEKNPSDMENNVNSANISKGKPNPPAAQAGPTAPVQTGRRKKGHFPCSSTNSMPRRAHLRSGGNPRVNQTFQMISSNSWVSTGNANSTQNLDSMHESTSKRKRSSNAANAAQANASASACGIAIVGGGAPTATTASNVINKNLKLVEIFPTAAASTKKRQRQSAPNNATPKGHFLQESKRRQDLQNANKRSFVNNDRRSAQQRRVQKGAAAAGSGARNTK